MIKYPLAALLLASLILLPVLATAQTEPAQKAETSVERDSVYAKFMSRGAWREHLFSQRRLALTDSALKYLPDDAYLWQQRSMPLAKQRKYELSIQFMDSAVKYDSLKYIAYRGFLKCIYQKDLNGALRDLRLAKAWQPDAYLRDHPIDYLIGMCHLQLSKYDIARDCFQYCVAQDLKAGPDWVHKLNYFYLGVSEYELRDHDATIRNMEAVLRIDSNFADAKYYKAAALHESGLDAEALSLFQEARSSLAHGHTFDEDDSPYERYPYQITTWMVNGYINLLEKKLGISLR